MNITQDTARLVYQEISQILSAETDLVGVSCIARGADSVFARAVLDLGGRLEVVLPSRDYRERKVKPDHAEQFDEFLRRAEVRVMDFDTTGAEAYEAANDAVLSSCDRLIAVWDGMDSVRAGTGAVVAQARAKGVPVERVWPEGAERG
ncbi:hypothetical protein [Nocardia callitridis]